MKVRAGAERYRIGVSGDTVQAWDMQKETLLTYRRRRLEDSIHMLDVSGTVTVESGQIVDVTALAASTGYIFGRDKQGIVLSKRSNPNWKLHLTSNRKATPNPLSPSRAVLKFQNGGLALLDMTGIYRLILNPYAPSTGNPTEFHLGGDFSP